MRLDSRESTLDGSRKVERRSTHTVRLKCHFTSDNCHHPDPKLRSRETEVLGRGFGYKE